MNSETVHQLPTTQLLDSMRAALAFYLDRSPLLIGIQTGGVWVAEELHSRLGLEEPIGAIDISFYRDDFSQIGVNPKVRSSNLPVSIDNRHVILADDVLHTGRTVRAALNELFAWGRPSSVILAVLVNRGNRELPFSADVVGQSMTLANDQFVKVSRDGAVTYTQRGEPQEPVT